MARWQWGDVLPDLGASYNDESVQSMCRLLPPPQDLIVDQTIEKVSFCAPDRNFDKAFSYICRDGTTRRWICHGFLALKDSVSAGFPPCHKGPEEKLPLAWWTARMPCKPLVDLRRSGGL